MKDHNWVNQVKKIGRTCWRNDKLWLAFSGTGISFRITGKQCTIRLIGDSTSVSPTPDTHTARYALYVDGVRKLQGMMEEPQRELVVLNLEQTDTAEVLFVKISESAMSTLAIADVETDGIIEPVADVQPLIEFVGDSITCGYGVDTNAPDQAFHTNNEDATKAYAWKTADLLKADRTLVSLSGYGVLSGWTADPNTPSKGQLIPKFYEKIGFSYAESDGEHVQDWGWDFAAHREPDAVVINLGTNDASYTVDDPAKQEQYRVKYHEFLNTIRSRNPHAYILCVLGVMGDVLYPSLEQTVREYSASSGDERVEAMWLEGIRPEQEGYVSDFHPAEVTHARVAEKVAERLEQILTSK